MSDQSKLIWAITKFLREQLKEDAISDDCAEGLSIGIQCLEAAYNINSEHYSNLDIKCGLQEIFEKHLKECTSDISTENKNLAETIKNEGNSHMNFQNFKEAVDCYSRAIKLDSNNAVYYCNRAAASNNLGDYESAIKDCYTALKINPLYHKAYARLGLAYSNKNQHNEAIANYRKAVELQPDNETYKASLKLAEEAGANNSLSCTISIDCSGSSASTTFPNMNNVDLAGLLSTAAEIFQNQSVHF